MTKRYMFCGNIVEATRDIGGGFYDATVIETGLIVRFYADQFENAAKELPLIMSSAADPEAAC
jgi:hypothetical protein